jgi:fluoroacetyl-CoA thioesterase
MSAAGPAATGPGLVPGLRASVRVTVAEADTAQAFGSGDVPVLATPRLLALAEAAAVASVAPHIAPGFTTVGTAASLEHRRASPPGAGIVVEAELVEVDGTRLAFNFIARPEAAGDPGGTGDSEGSDSEGTGDSDGTGQGVVGAGTHERVVVDRARFLARAHRP